MQLFAWRQGVVDLRHVHVEPRDVWHLLCVLLEAQHYQVSNVIG